MSIGRADLIAAVERLAAAMERDAQMLNAADGALGDGDLGVTMTRGMRLVSERAAELRRIWACTCLQCAQAFNQGLRLVLRHAAGDAG